MVVEEKAGRRTGRVKEREREEGLRDKEKEN